MRNFIIMAFIFGFLFIACEKPSRSELPAQVRLDVKNIPANNNLLFYCNFKDLSGTPFAKDMLGDAKKEIRKRIGSEEYAELQEALNLEGLQEILVGANTQAQEPEELYMMFHGTFDENRMVDFLKNKAKEKGEPVRWQVQEVNGQRVYLFNKKKHFAATITGSDLCFFGPQDWVIKMAKKQKIENRLDENQAMMSLLKKVKYGNQAWIIANQPLQNARGRFISMKSPQAEKIKASIQAIVFSVQVFQELKFAGQILSDSSDNSKLLADLMRGGLAAAKLSVAGDRNAVDALNAIKIQQKGKETVVNGVVTQDFLEILKSRHLAMYER